ncbi:uncharacterized protein LOC124344613 [Daphnia pulicaria]|uniref:uncharacterized protein LOC124344608 n=1 Tax=Daphnia pulicaria TaxID=35523 RepID=UPI001EE9DD98|nr:uncharacterized protein LOC124344608 [Daphnia pulicaria]XP_046654173.1 uncharacterized protein LOC124344613 [Daphnia pulicaria]
MPRLPQPESLVKLCVKCVTNASRRSANKIPAVMRNCNMTAINSKFFPNAFHQLPVALLEEIIFAFTMRRMRDRGRMPIPHPYFLHYLITPQIQHLSFSLYYGGYLGLFPKLENLLTLDLGKTGVKDDSLKSIGIYCSQLRSLNLKGCTDVTDDGIRWLCGVDLPGMGKSRLCKTIQKLSILHTSVTKKGIQVALKNFLFLNILENCYIVDALAELAQSAIDSKQPGFYNNTFSISTLYTSPDTPLRSNSLPLALPLCHLVNQVSICVTKELKDSDLLCLLSIKMLRKLEIGGSSFCLITGETAITFDGGVAPLLKAFGRSLETLMLGGIKLVCLSSIIEFCPNLISLFISGTSGSFKDEDLFQVPADILFVLLSFPSLEKISIGLCDSLTDESIIVKRLRFSRSHEPPSV